MRSKPLLKIQKWWLTGICFFLALLALLAPVWPGTSVENYLGGLLLWVAVIEMIHGFSRSVETERRSAWFSGVFSLLMAVLLINAELLLRSALDFFICTVFALDAARYLFKFYKGSKISRGRWEDLASAIGNLLLILAFFVFKEKGL